MIRDLHQKYEKQPNFKKEVDLKAERYANLGQAALYSDLSCVPDDIVKKLPNQDIFIYLGYKQPTQTKLLPQVAMQFLSKFRPDTSRPYKFIFFNFMCPDNYVLWNFREIMGILPLHYLQALDQMIIVRPYFYHKAMDWMVFGNISKYIKSKTVFCPSIAALCQRLKMSPQMIINQLPQELYSEQFPELIPRTVPIMNLRQNISGQQRCEQQMVEMQEFHKTMNSILMKPGNEINCISDYEMSEIGVPVILKMLIFYFRNNEEHAKLEGLFRKSVSIDEETEIIEKIRQHNYDYLLSVENPHIIANLIKRFFSSLKEPIIPFEVFDFLMGAPPNTNPLQHLKQAIQMLPPLNKRVLVFLVNFLNQIVIQNQSSNKMGSQNLSICFGPCLLRAKQITEASLMHAAKSPMFTKLMMTNTIEVFGCLEQQEELYRRSYDQVQKSFQASLDIGIEETIKDLDKLQESKTVRCSTHIKDSQQNEEQLVLIEKQPQMKINFHKAQQQKQEQQSQQEGDNIKDQKPQKQQSIISIHSEQNDSKQQAFLSMIDDAEETPNSNPRISRNFDTGIHQDKLPWDE